VFTDDVPGDLGVVVTREPEGTDSVLLDMLSISDVAVLASVAAGVVGVSSALVCLETDKVLLLIAVDSVVKVLLVVVVDDKFVDALLAFAVIVDCSSCAVLASVAEATLPREVPIDAISVILGLTETEIVSLEVRLISAAAVVRSVAVVVAV
jgi:hypothetical protein